MAVITFPFRNKLAYPAGRLAGFDPSHIAASNCGFSGVGGRGNFSNLLSAVQGTNVNNPTSSIHGGLGAVTNYTQAVVSSTIFPFVSSTTALTLAAIFKVDALGSAPMYALNNNAGGAQHIGDINVAGFFSGGGGIQATVAYTLGAPYFLAASSNGSVTNLIFTRLDTGQVFFTSGAEAIGTGDGTLTVGSRGNGNARQINGAIAAAMAANAYLSEQQLRQWANDPWAFWYPPQASSLVSATAAIPTTTLYQLINW